MRRSISCWATIGACAVVPLLAQAQEAPQEMQEALDVFLDCQTFFCDFDHFRREITFVNWMRDQRDADVHVLITAQQTGGGGWEFTFAFIGRDAFAGRTDTLQYTSRNTDTQAEIRQGLTQTIALGLVEYVARTPLGQRLEIRLPQQAAGELQQARPEDDPWNFWTFRVSLNGSLSGEATQDRRSLNASLSASRVTEAFKINISMFGRSSRDEFELDDTTSFVNTSENYSADVLSVWSLGPHWSVGFGVDGNRSTFSNRDLAVSSGPAIEYNIFPYDESTRQQLTFLYRIEGAYFDYEEITVEGKTTETLPRHSLSVGASVQQPWGQINGSIRGTQYLHDPAVHRIDTFAFSEFRLFRGLNFNLFGNFSRIKDQFFLPAVGLTEEEILVRRRQRETDYSFSIRLGFSYRFGSKFANVVNPRMGSGGGIIFF